MAYDEDVLEYEREVIACRAEIEQLRAALNRIADVGAKFAPRCAPDKSWPPGASARYMDLEPLKVEHFVAAHHALEQQAREREEIETSKALDIVERDF